jgi:hypothetical protein
MTDDLPTQAEANRALAREIRTLALELDTDWEGRCRLIEYARALEEEATLLKLASRE